MSAWQRRSINLEDIERDLLLLGLSEPQAAGVVTFLKRIESTKKKVWVQTLEASASISGLLTLDDINLLWDVRPIFGGFNFHYFHADADSETYDKCFGLMCIATLELMASDSEGNKQRLAVQLTEETFKLILRAFERADGQLRSLTELIKSIQPSPNFQK